MPLVNFQRGIPKLSLLMKVARIGYNHNVKEVTELTMDNARKKTPGKSALKQPVSR